MNTDDCVEHTCANGGVCVDGVGNYSCRCPLQYTGKCRGFVPWPSLRACRFLLGQLPARAWGQLLSFLLVLSPGRACEQLVDFCSPDLNPCQHEAQCVGTPDGPRSVLPVLRARQGHGP